MTPELIGLVGGLLGATIGIIGGIIGTRCSLASCQSPREKQVMTKFSWAVWAFAILFCVLLFVTPTPYKWFLWIPYPFLLVWGILKVNRKIAEVRAEEAARA